MVSGSFPQLNVTTPPPATAATTLSPVQLAAVPSPTTVVGDEMSSASAVVGTGHFPAGFPFGPVATVTLVPPLEPPLLLQALTHARKKMAKVEGWFDRIRKS
jgi:hypothetical protein